MTYLRARRSIKVGPRFQDQSQQTQRRDDRRYPWCALLSVNSSGTRTTTAGIPGTGVSVIDRKSGKRPAGTAKRAAQSQRVAAGRQGKRHAGLLASHHERVYAKALGSLRKGKTAEALVLLDEAIASDIKHEAIAAHLTSAITRFKAGELEAAVTHLEPVISAHGHIDDDPLFER